MKKLRLTLKKKWFDMILSGEKKEEYREIKEYWVRRLIDFKEDVEPEVLDEFITDLSMPYFRHHSVRELFKYFGASFKKFDVVEFKNGYNSHNPYFIIDLLWIEIDAGLEDQGAEDGKFYFVLRLGEIIK
jgi:hypothetical protein